jgi:leucyl aminopeptidase
MNYLATQEALLSRATDCICLPVFDKGLLCSQGKQLDEALSGALSQYIATFRISGETGKTAIFPVQHAQFKRVILAGFGESEKLDRTALRKTLKSLASMLKDNNVSQVSLDFSQLQLADKTQNQNVYVTDTILAIEESIYNFDQFKSKKASNVTLQEVIFHDTDEDTAKTDALIAVAKAQSEGMKLTKDLGNLPGNVCTPLYLAEQAQKLAESHDKLSVKVLDEDDLEALNMGAFLSVAKGSIEPAKLVVLEYKGAENDQAPHVLVGKGITFDTGGISLKPGPQMDEMKYDMCGAASVLGTLLSLTRLNARINVIGLLACAENMPAGHASKPGDIVTTASGQTVEILNTDAEGRLVLCDTLTYAEQFKPASVIDIATLTGACIIALGDCTSAVMGNNQVLVDEILKAGQSANDKAWQLPIWDEYQEQLDSPFADMQNIGGKGAGSITAACFLSRYTKNYPWAHLDIAGTAWVSGGKNKGATGRPVPLLLNYLLSKIS